MSDLWSRANSCIPGGVNSPVRAFSSVGRDPVFIERASGAYVYDTDGKEYIDFVGSWGPMILGHSHPAIVEAVQKAAAYGVSFGACCEAEVEFAELLVSLLPSVDMIRMVNSGTEATMSAVRLARGYTGREKIVKFRGCYHGHADFFLIEAGSGALTYGTPNSAGVTKGAAQDTLLADYNNLESVAALFEANENDIAAIILEPVAGNMGVVVPDKSFILGLQELCQKSGTVLIFDEVMTGFRVTETGAQGYFGVEPDLSTFGKIIGGGLPVGAYGGKKEIMERVSPLGDVYQAGTLSGNPLAMHAGLAAFKELAKPGFYADLNAKSDHYIAALRKVIEPYDMQINAIASMATLFFTGTPVVSYAEAAACDTEKYGAFFRGMLDEGVYLAPSQFEAGFVSAAHTADDLDAVVQKVAKVLATL
ncbi:MAG: glutamate-1-semialdehyde 2,1-aminomutase [Fibrobacterales bacterium]